MRKATAKIGDQSATVIVPSDPRQYDLKTALAGKSAEVPSNMSVVRGKLDLQRDTALGFALLGNRGLLTHLHLNLPGCRFLLRLDAL